MLLCSTEIKCLTNLRINTVKPSLKEVVESSDVRECGLPKPSATGYTVKPEIIVNPPTPNSALIPAPRKWTLDQESSKSSRADCSHETKGITSLGRPPGTRVLASLGSPRHGTPTYPLVCRGWQVCSYDLLAWEKGCQLDSRVAFSLGKDCKLAVREMQGSWLFRWILLLLFF